jgi:hypothetical protein
MPIEHLDGAGLAPTHRGFSGPPGPAAPDEAPRGPPRNLGVLMAAGLAVAAVLGVTLGLLSKPARLNVAEEPRVMNAVSAAAPPVDPPPSGPQMQIVVDPVKPPTPPPKAATPLEVLPSDMAAAAPKAVVAPSPRAAPEPPPPEEPPSSTFADAAVPLPPRARPSFACDGDLSRAREMVCADPRLAARDRRLTRAYRRALESGVPRGELRDEQADWDDIREDAARVSPEALAQVYDQRIRELEDFAMSQRGDW